MVWSHVQTAAVLELIVMLLQLMGVVALLLNRLVPHTRWSDLGRSGLIVAVIGLGIAGALCGRHDSEFALFAGGTLTFLLIAMTTGNSATLAAPLEGPTLAGPLPEANLAG